MYVKKIESHAIEIAPGEPLAERPPARTQPVSAQADTRQNAPQARFQSHSQRNLTSQFVVYIPRAASSIPRQAISTSAGWVRQLLNAARMPATPL